MKKLARHVLCLQHGLAHNTALPTFACTCESSEADTTASFILSLFVDYNITLTVFLMLGAWKMTQNWVLSLQDSTHSTRETQSPEAFRVQMQSVCCRGYWPHCLCHFTPAPRSSSCISLLFLKMYLNVHHRLRLTERFQRLDDLVPMLKMILSGRVKGRLASVLAS